VGDLVTLIVPAGPHFTTHAPSLLPVGSCNHKLPTEQPIGSESQLDDDQP